MGYIANLVLFYVTVSAVSKGNEPEGCDTEQYLNVGRRGIINCSFDEHFFGVFWYDSLDSATTYPLISLQESVKSGDGYISGQYDVLPNGSLVIRNVSFENDHMFRAILLKTKEDDSIVYDVRVHVTVKSDQPFPYIDVCGEEPFCFVNFSKHKIVSCAVHGTQPAVEISWAVHNESGVWRLPSKTNELPNGPEGHLSSTTASTSLEYKPLRRIEHLVCTVNSPPNIIAHVESHLFLENTVSSYSSEESTTKHVQVGTRFVLTCSIIDQTFLIWKKKSSDNQWQTIAHVFFGDTVFLKTHSEYYSLDESGSLIVPFAQIFNEGSYMCIYHQHFAKTFEVIVYVSPQPPYVTVEGCEDDQQCSLEVLAEGNLTCSVQQIWPKIKLEWIPFPESSATYITFLGQEESVEKTGDTYNITLKSRFVLKDLTQSKVTILCMVSGWDKSISDLDRTVELQFAIEGVPVSKFQLWTIIVIVITFIVIILLALSTVVMLRRKKVSQSVRIGGSDQDNDKESVHSKLLEDKEKQQDATPHVEKVENKLEVDENTSFVSKEKKQDATPDPEATVKSDSEITKQVPCMLKGKDPPVDKVVGRNLDECQGKQGIYEKDNSARKNDPEEKPPLKSSMKKNQQSLNIKCAEKPAIHKPEETEEASKSIIDGVKDKLKKQREASMKTIPSKLEDEVTWRGYVHDLKEVLQKEIEANQSAHQKGTRET